MGRSTSSPELRVLDASVVINLLAIETSVARAVLTARGGRFAITAVVLDNEALWDPRADGVPADALLASLMAGGLVERASLSEAATSTFVDLAMRLGDGEAATIAHCSDVAAIALLEDGGAHPRAVASGVAIEWTTDVLLHRNVTAQLGRKVLAEAVHDALRFGRMRVPERHWDEVLNLIGIDRARDCPSIPRRAFAKKR